VFKIKKKVRFNKKSKTQKNKVNSKIQKIRVLKNRKCKNMKKKI